MVNVDWVLNQKWLHASWLVICPTIFTACSATVTKMQPLTGFPWFPLRSKSLTVLGAPCHPSSVLHQPVADVVKYWFACHHTLASLSGLFRRSFFTGPSMPVLWLKPEQRCKRRGEKSLGVKAKMHTRRLKSTMSCRDSHHLAVLIRSILYWLPCRKLHIGTVFRAQACSYSCKGRKLLGASNEVVHCISQLVISAWIHFYASCKQPTALPKPRHTHTP